MVILTLSSTRTLLRIIPTHGNQYITARAFSNTLIHARNGSEHHNGIPLTKEMSKRPDKSSLIKQAFKKSRLISDTLLPKTVMAGGVEEVEVETRETSSLAPPGGVTKVTPPPPAPTSPSSNTPTRPAPPSKAATHLTHLNAEGEAWMVDISPKLPTLRTAVAKATLYFSNPTAAELIKSNTNKKGDVLGVARIAGIMASKRCSELIPLCHPVMISKVTVDVELRERRVSESEAQKEELELKTGLGTLNRFGSVEITAEVSCEGKTGVEMEALTAVTVAGLTVYDMCKAVDRHMRIDGGRVVEKRGGKGGDWSSE